MKEIDIQQIIDMNYRVLTLLGIATSLIIEYEQYCTQHTDSSRCKWFLDAIQAVVYENKPLPPMP